MTGSTNMSIGFKDRNLIKTMIDNSNYTKDLVIPDDITSIMVSAFEGRTGFKGKLLLPNGLLSIGVSAFKDCTGFNGTLTIGTGITALQEYVFKDCSGFKKLIIPNNITNIGIATFANCTGLTDIDCYPTTPPPIRTSSFTNVTAKFYVPANNIYAYKTATNWVSFAVRIMGRKDYIIDDTFENFAQGSYTTTTWYASKEDLVAGTNPIASGTTVGATGTYYCTLT